MAYTNITHLSFPEVNVNPKFNERRWDCMDTNGHNYGTIVRQAKQFYIVMSAFSMKDVVFESLDEAKFAMNVLYTFKG